MSILAAFLIAVALLAGLGGLASLSQATMGVGILAFACLCGIFARMAQAASYHKERR